MSMAHKILLFYLLSVTCEPNMTQNFCSLLLINANLHKLHIRCVFVTLVNT